MASDSFTLASSRNGNWTDELAATLAGRSIDDLQITLAAPATYNRVEGIVTVVLSPAGVPEPASWALMIFGFLALGAALRSRRHPLPAACLALQRGRGSSLSSSSCRAASHPAVQSHLDG